MSRRYYTYDPRITLRGTVEVFPRPRQVLRRTLRERYGKAVRLAGEEGSYFFLDLTGEVIPGAPCGHIRKMLRGDVEGILADLARVVPYTEGRAEGCA